MKLTIYRSILCMSAALALSCADDATTPDLIDPSDENTTTQAPLRHFCKAFTDRDDDGVIDIIEENQFGPNGSFTYTNKKTNNGEPSYTYKVVNNSQEKPLRIEYIQKNSNSTSINQQDYIYNKSHQLILKKTKNTSKPSQQNDQEITEKYIYNEDGSLFEIQIETALNNRRNTFTITNNYKENEILTYYQIKDRKTLISTTKFAQDGKFIERKILKQPNSEESLEYDAQNRLDAITYKDGKYEISYNDKKISRISYTSKQASSSSVHLITYDKSNRPIERSRTTSQGTSTLTQYKYLDNKIYIYEEENKHPYEIYEIDKDNNVIKYVREPLIFGGDDLDTKRQTTTYDYSCLNNSNNPPSPNYLWKTDCNPYKMSFDDYKKLPCDSSARSDAALTSLRKPFHAKTPFELQPVSWHLPMLSYYLLHLPF